MPEPERRYKVLRIDPELLVEMFNNPPITQLTIDPPLPTGTRVVSVQAEWTRGTLALLLHHPDFEPVPFGQEYPDYCLRFTRLEVPHA